MVTERLLINSDAQRIENATEATERFASAMNLDNHAALRLQLLTEETLGMVKSMVDEFYGQIWFEGEGTKCEIHLEATAIMDADKKSKIMSVSSTGRNALTHGFMSRLGEMISSALHSMGEAMDFYGEETMRYGIIRSGDMSGAPALSDMTPIWTLSNYRAVLSQEKETDTEADMAWDDLQKSIVAKLADDVVVGVKSDRIVMVITKDFAA